MSRPDQLSRTWCIPWKNTSATDCPPFGIIESTGVWVDGNLQGVRPTGSTTAPIYFNHEITIPPGGIGSATQDTPFWAAYDEADGTPAALAEWGPQSGTWLLKNAGTGFTIEGDHGGGVVKVSRKTSAAASTGPLYVHVRSKTLVAVSGPTPEHWEYTVRAVERTTASGGVTWGEVSGAADITGVREDQNRILVVDGTGGTCSQAYELRTDPNGYYFIERDQDADIIGGGGANGYGGGTVSTGTQTWRGRKNVRGLFQVQKAADTVGGAGSEGTVTAGVDVTSLAGATFTSTSSASLELKKVNGSGFDIYVRMAAEADTGNAFIQFAGSTSIWSSSIASLNIGGVTLFSNLGVGAVPSYAGYSPGAHANLAVYGPLDILGSGTGPSYAGATTDIALTDEGITLHFVAGLFVGYT